MKVVNCRSEEHANAYLAELAKQGLKWNSGIRLTEHTNWEFYMPETCYNVEENGVLYCSASYYLERGYQIEVYKGESTQAPDNELHSFSAEIVYDEETREWLCNQFKDMADKLIEFYHGRNDIVSSIEQIVTQLEGESNENIQ